MDDRNRQAMERLKSLFEAGDFQAMINAEYELAADDFVEEWPQSGERIRGRDNARAINENYPASTGSTPSFSVRRLTGEGSTWVAEGTIDYGDGTPVSYVGIVELRDGRVARITEYFANPFPAPEWRAKWVERMEPVTA